MHLSQEQGVTHPKEGDTPHREPTPHQVHTPLREGIKGVHLQPGVTQRLLRVAPIRVEDPHLQGRTHRKVNVRFIFSITISSV